jgi:hypothetical protein
MTIIVFTAGRQSPRGSFYPHDSAPEVSMDAAVAAELLSTFGIIDRHLRSDPGHAIVDPVHLAEWLADPVPVVFQIEIDALVRLCDFAHEHDVHVAWGY